MAIDFISRERRTPNSNSPMERTEAPTLFVGSASIDSEIDGLELTQAARVLGISVDDLWRQVRNGKLIARTERGQVLVYTDSVPQNDTDGLPPLPTYAPAGYSPVFEEKIDVKATVRMETPNVSALVANQDSTTRQEIALLIDHLSLAKEENREILRLTNESMMRLTEMTDKILDMKDAMIAAKDEQMQFLRDRLNEQANELRQALREKENLETLTEALQGL